MSDFSSSLRRTDFEDLEESNGQPRDRNEYFYQWSVDAADRVRSTPFAFFNKPARAGAGGRGSDGSGGARSPLGEYNFFSSYLDSNTVAPLLSSYFSQDSDEVQNLRDEEVEQRQPGSVRIQSQRLSGRNQYAPPGGSNRNSTRTTPDLFPSLYNR